MSFHARPCLVWFRNSLSEGKLRGIKAAMKHQLASPCHLVKRKPSHVFCPNGPATPVEKGPDSSTSVYYLRYQGFSTICSLSRYHPGGYFLNRNSWDRPGLGSAGEAAIRLGLSPRAKRQTETLGEGQMMRVFVVLSWAAFAVRQILMKPARVLHSGAVRSR